MNSEIKLPPFQHIDTELGLKFLNNNKKLYLKILTNFLNRYQNLKIEDLDDKQLRDTIHAMKGLSATLGMVSVSQLATTIHETQNREKLSAFSKALTLVIDELQMALKEDKPKTILVVSDNTKTIDMLIAYLDDPYDVVVALDRESALESMSEEDISLVLLDKDMKNINSLYPELEEKMIPILLTNHSFNINQLKNDIKAQLKFKDIK